MDSNSPYKDILSPCGPTLAQKPFNLVGTKLMFLAVRIDVFPFHWEVIYLID